MAEKTPTEALFDQAVESAGLRPRTDVESVQAYVDAVEWGPNTKAHLASVAEAAGKFNLRQAVDSASSARQHHDDPNPPDAHPLKR